MIVIIISIIIIIIIIIIFIIIIIILIIILILITGSFLWGGALTFEQTVNVLINHNFLGRRGLISELPPPFTKQYYQLVLIEVFHGFIKIKLKIHKN